MIVGRALATTVPARIATNMPAISPDMAWSICRRDMGAGGADKGASGAVTTSLSTVGGAAEEGRQEGPEGRKAEGSRRASGAGRGPVDAARRTDGRPGGRWSVAPRLPRRCREPRGQQGEHFAEDVGEGAFVLPERPVLHAHPDRR